MGFGKRENEDLGIVGGGRREEWEHRGMEELGKGNAEGVFNRGRLREENGDGIGKGGGGRKGEKRGEGEMTDVRHGGEEGNGKRIKMAWAGGGGHWTK